MRHQGTMTLRKSLQGELDRIAGLVIDMAVAVHSKVASWCPGVLVVSFFFLSVHELASNDIRGTQLAKEVRSKGWVVFSARDANGNWDLFLMRPDRSSQHNITQTTDFNETGSRFSPDGQK